MYARDHHKVTSEHVLEYDSESYFRNMDKTSTLEGSIAKLLLYN